MIQCINRNSSILIDKSIKINDKQEMKTIGILGGLGPQATMDLEMHIHNISQQLIPKEKNSGYPPMVVQYYRHSPVLLVNGKLPVIPLQPDPRLLETAGNLGAISDFLLICSNGIHMFQNEIEIAAGRKVLSMINVTLEEIKSKGWRKVGVLGLMNATIYTNALAAIDIVYEIIDDELQEKLDQAIFKVMEGGEDESDCAVALEAIQQLRYKKVDVIVLGCTEIPFLLKENMNEQDILNPVQLLAVAAVKYCINY